MPQPKMYDDDEFVTAIEEWPQDVAATSEVASEVGCSTPTAKERLEDLAEQGKVKKISTRPGVIWEVAE